MCLMKISFLLSDKDFFYILSFFSTFSLSILNSGHHEWIADDCNGLLTLSIDSTVAQDCNDVVPCAHWVNTGNAANAPAQTCTEYCKQVSNNAATCVNSWSAPDAGADPGVYCKPKEQKPCNESYTATTSVVCVCAKVAKCTLFAKCDKHSEVYTKMPLYGEVEGNQSIGFSIDPRMYQQTNGQFRVALSTRLTRVGYAHAPLDNFYRHPTHLTICLNLRQHWSLIHRILILRGNAKTVRMKISSIQLRILRYKLAPQSVRKSPDAIYLRMERQIQRHANGKKHWAGATALVQIQARQI